MKGKRLLIIDTGLDNVIPTLSKKYAIERYTPPALYDFFTMTTPIPEAFITKNKKYSAIIIAWIDKPGLFKILHLIKTMTELNTVPILIISDDISSQPTIIRLGCDVFIWKSKTSSSEYAATFLKQLQYFIKNRCYPHLSKRKD